jgi:outer membrane protein assembly factor BamB
VHSGRGAWHLAVALVAIALSGCGIALDPPAEDDDDGGETPLPLPVVTLSVVPASIAVGQSVAVSWSSHESSACMAVGHWGGPLPLTGSEDAAIYEPGTYDIGVECSGPGGSTNRFVQVQVVGQPVAVTMSADPVSVPVGGTSTLSWSAPMATTCTAVVNWIGNRPTSGSAPVTVALEGANRYELFCQARIGQVHGEVTVTGVQSRVTLSAAPETVGAGQATTLTWSSTQASGCVASGAWSGAKAASGSEEVTAPALGTHDFSLSCSNPGAAGTDSATVTAVAPTLVFRAFPASVPAGEPVTLSWESAYAKECTASGGWSGAKTLASFETFTPAAAGSVEYILTCGNDGGNAMETATITATAAATAVPAATAYQINARHDGATNLGAGFTLPALSVPAWTREFDTTVNYPLIADGRVYVLTQGDGAGGRLHALDPQTGATLWGPVTVSGGTPAGHAYANGRVFVQTFGGMLRAYDAATGAPMWSHPLPGYWYDSPPVAYGGYVFTMGLAYGLHALDETTGMVVWSQLALSGSDSAPALASDGLYTMTQCRLLGVNPATGATRWTRETECQGATRTVALRDAELFVRRLTSPSDDGRRIDANSGTDAADMSTQTIPAVTDTTFFTLSADGTLAAIDRTDNTEAWTYVGDGDLVSAPIVVNGIVFVGSGSGIVFAVDAATGVQQWFGVAPSPILGPDEHNLAGLAAGEGLLVVPAGNSVAAWRLL